MEPGHTCLSSGQPRAWGWVPRARAPAGPCEVSPVCLSPTSTGSLLRVMSSCPVREGPAKDCSQCPAAKGWGELTDGTKWRPGLQKSAENPEGLLFSNNIPLPLWDLWQNWGPMAESGISGTVRDLWQNFASSEGISRHKESRHSPCAHL